MLINASDADTGVGSITRLAQSWAISLAAENKSVRTIGGYTETVNHEANMPNFLKSDAAIKQLQSDMLTNGGLSMDARLADLVKSLQTTFGGG